MSAMSEHDDFGLVNLHMQVNKPITDSPLLMSSYISHLSQYRCSYWDETVSILRTGIVVYYLRFKKEVVKLPHLEWCGLSYYQPQEAKRSVASRGW